MRQWSRGVEESRSRSRVNGQVWANGQVLGKFSMEVTKLAPSGVFYLWEVSICLSMVFRGNTLPASMETVRFSLLREFLVFGVRCLV